MKNEFSTYAPERIGCIGCTRKYYLSGSDVFLLFDDRRRCKTCAILQDVALYIPDDEAEAIMNYGYSDKAGSA